MTPTEATRTYYMKAAGLAACARTFVSLGMWRDAHRALDNAKEYWLLVEWQHQVQPICCGSCPAGCVVSAALEHKS